MGRENIDDIAPHPKGAAVEIGVISVIEDFDQSTKQNLSVDGVSHRQLNDNAPSIESIRYYIEDVLSNEGRISLPGG